MMKKNKTVLYEKMSNTILKLKLPIRNYFCEQLEKNLPKGGETYCIVLMQYLIGGVVLGQDAHDAPQFHPPLVTPWHPTNRKHTTCQPIILCTYT